MTAPRPGCRPWCTDHVARFDTWHAADIDVCTTRYTTAGGATVCMLPSPRDPGLTVWDCDGCGGVRGYTDNDATEDGARRHAQDCQATPEPTDDTTGGPT